MQSDTIIRHLTLGFVLASALAPIVRGETTVTFDELHLPGNNTYWNGSDGSGEFASQGVRFSNDYSHDWASWTGFAFSNADDTTTPGYSNQYASISGAGLGGDGNYAVAYAAGEDDLITLPEPTLVMGLYLNNTTYAALSMQDGDGFAKKFGGPDGTEPDWYRLTISGKDSVGALSGTAEFYLADYRFEDPQQDYIVRDWTFVDLTGLGDQVTQVEFSVDSSDRGAFGMNTPGYVAMDNLSVAVVPEPSSMALLLLGGLALGLRARKVH